MVKTILYAEKRKSEKHYVKAAMNKQTFNEDKEVRYSISAYSLPSKETKLLAYQLLSLRTLHTSVEREVNADVKI